MDGDPLPQGWVVKHSRSKNGKIYYLNTITGVSTWRKPHASSETQVTKKQKNKSVKEEKQHSTSGKHKIKQTKTKLFADKGAIKQANSLHQDSLHQTKERSKDLPASSQTTKFSPFKIVKSSDRSASGKVVARFNPLLPRKKIDLGNSTTGGSVLNRQQTKNSTGAFKNVLTRLQVKESADSKNSFMRKLMKDDSLARSKISFIRQLAKDGSISRLKDSFIGQLTKDDSMPRLRNSFIRQLIKDDSTSGSKNKLTLQPKTEPSSVYPKDALTRHPNKEPSSVYPKDALTRQSKTEPSSVYPKDALTRQSKTEPSSVYPKDALTRQSKTEPSSVYPKDALTRQSKTVADSPLFHEYDTCKKASKRPHSQSEEEGEYDHTTNTETSWQSSRKEVDINTVTRARPDSENIQTAHPRDHPHRTKSEKRDKKYRFSYEDPQNGSRTSKTVSEAPTCDETLSYGETLSYEDIEESPSSSKNLRADSSTSSTAEGATNLTGSIVSESRPLGETTRKNASSQLNYLPCEVRNLPPDSEQTLLKHEYTENLRLGESSLKEKTSYCDEGFVDSSFHGNSPCDGHAVTLSTSHTNQGQEIFESLGLSSSQCYDRNDNMNSESDGICSAMSGVIPSMNLFPSTLPGKSSWRTGTSGVEFINKVGNFCSSRVSSYVSAGSPSLPCGSELAVDTENDIEDMEVDEEGIMILSNLQDVRMQVSLTQGPQGILTETVTRTRPSSTPTQLNSSTNNSSKPKLFLVVDTNVFISCLCFLRDILGCNISGYGDVIFVLPWVVVQELDYLKNGKGRKNNSATNDSTSHRAASAVRFIHSLLIAHSPKLIGQTPQQAQELNGLRVECNDDKILQCCTQWDKKYSGNLVLLLTRDVNLINKATIMGIKAASNETLWTRLNVADPLVGKSQVKMVKKPVINKTSREESNNKVKEAAKVPSVKEIKIRQVQSPQTESEKSIVMDKFQAVWGLIFDIKSKIAAVISEGRSHTNFMEAVEMIKVLGSLLTALRQDFDRCLALSPVILWEHEAEFGLLCERLNTFHSRAHHSCTDPSLPVGTMQLMKHFYGVINRPTLLTGLDQLSAFIQEFGEMMRQCL